MIEYLKVSSYRTEIATATAGFISWIQLKGTSRLVDSTPANMIQQRITRIPIRM